VPDQRGSVDGEVGVPPVPLAVLLPRVGAAVARHRRRLAAHSGLTPTAVDVLAALDPGDAPSHREIAARLGLSPATLTPVLDALEAGGQVRRERDALDRRVVRVRRTPAGQALLAAAQPTSRLPAPANGHEPAIRSYLLAVLAALEAEE
jgi:MarR family transcriptional regulator, organic hydroperoxide resistance regulator